MCVKLFFEPPSQRFGMQLGPDFYAGRGTARHIGGCHCRMWTIGAAPAAAGAGCGAELYLNAGRAITVRLAERYTADSAVTDGLLLHGVYCRDKATAALETTSAVLGRLFLYGSVGAPFAEGWLESILVTKKAHKRQQTAACAFRENDLIQDTFPNVSRLAKADERNCKNFLHHTDKSAGSSGEQAVRLARRIRRFIVIAPGVSLRFIAKIRNIQRNIAAQSAAVRQNPTDAHFDSLIYVDGPFKTLGASKNFFQ